MIKYQKTTIGLIIAILALVIIFFGFSILSEDPNLQETCGEGTILNDNEDLCWQRGVAPIDPENWEDANNYCKNLILAEDDDWRLPRVEELKQIADKSFIGIAIDPELFKNTKATHYWTSSEYSDGFHHYIHFETGFQGFAQDSRKGYGIRCVRDKTLF